MIPKTIYYPSAVNDAANIHLIGSFASHVTSRNSVIIVNRYASLTNNFSKWRKKVLIMINYYHVVFEIGNSYHESIIRRPCSVFYIAF